MPRPKQDDLGGMTGPGVAPVRYKDIDRLGDKFIETRDEKALLASKLGKLEEQIGQKMAEHGLAKYRFSDQEVIVKPGRNRIKIKTVEAVEDGGPEPEPEAA